ncbi:MAG: hypothetical protein NUW21_00785 [Elusimicrobia bacterium]|nr:hypothetical protein [Elusimicrobiota bacterium]
MKRLKCTRKLAYDRVHIDEICAKIAAGDRQYEEELLTAMSPRILSFVTGMVKRYSYLNDRLDDLYQAMCLSVVKYARKYKTGTVYASCFLERCFRLDFKGEAKQFMCRNGAKAADGANNDLTDPCFKDYQPLDAPLGAERSASNVIEAGTNRSTYDERNWRARLLFFKRMRRLRPIERAILCEAQGIVPFKATRDRYTRARAAKFKALPFEVIAAKHGLPIEHVRAIHDKAVVKMS